MDTQQQMISLNRFFEDVLDNDTDVADSTAFEPPAHKPRPDYVPSQREIREECRRIRETWSEHEHWKRAGYSGGRPRWHVSEYKALHASVD